MENTIKPFDLKNIFYTVVLSVVLLGSMQAVGYALATGDEKACMKKVSEVSFVMQTGALNVCMNDLMKEKSQRYEINRRS